VGLERSPLSLVRISKELLDWKSSGSGSRKLRLTAVGTRCADHVTTSIRRKLALTSPTCSGRSFGVVRLRTKATEFIFLVYCVLDALDCVLYSVEILNFLAEGFHNVFCASSQIL
jgi:hypothetical protein